MPEMGLFGPWAFATLPRDASRLRDHDRHESSSRSVSGAGVAGRQGGLDHRRWDGARSSDGQAVCGARCSRWLDRAHAGDSGERCRRDRSRRRPRRSVRPATFADPAAVDEALERCWRSWGGSTSWSTTPRATFFARPKSSPRTPSRRWSESCCTARSTARVPRAVTGSNTGIREPC